MIEPQSEPITFKYHANIPTEHTVSREKSLFTPRKPQIKHKSDRYVHSRSAQHQNRCPNTVEEDAVNILHDLSFSREFEDVNVKNLNLNLQQICKNNFDEFRKRKSPKKIQKVEKPCYSRKRPRSLQQARTERSQMSKSKQNLHSISSKQLQIKFSDELSQTVRATFREGFNVFLSTNYNNFPGPQVHTTNNNLIYLKPKVDNRPHFKNMPNKQIKFMNLQRQHYSSPYEYNTNLFENSFIKKQKIFNINPQKPPEPFQPIKNSITFRKYPNSASTNEKPCETTENLTPFINNNSHLTHLEYSQYSSKKSQLSSSPSSQNLNYLEPPLAHQNQQTLPNYRLYHQKSLTQRVSIPQTLYNTKIQSQFRQNDLNDGKLQQIFENFMGSGKKTPFQQYQGRRGVPERGCKKVEEGFLKVCSSNNDNKGNVKRKGERRAVKGEKPEKENKGDSSMAEQFYDDQMRKECDEGITVLSSRMNRMNQQRFGI